MGGTVVENPSVIVYFYLKIKMSNVVLHIDKKERSAEMSKLGCKQNLLKAG
jgi:hypothetical protein